MKKYFFVVLILLVILISLSIYFLFFQKDIQKLQKCNYDLSDIVENRYQEDKEERYIKCESSGGYASIFCKNGQRFEPAKHYTYWEIDGMLKNKSKNDQYLKSIILKIYTDDKRKILLAEGYIDIKAILTPGQSYPFQVRANINRGSKIGDYFKQNDKVKIDVYPYFLSCK